LTRQSEDDHTRRAEWCDVEGRSETVESETVFDGAIWSIRRDRFRFGDGELVREYVQHPGAVVVLALDDIDRVVMVLQYRHPTGHRHWELPAGLRDVAGEPALQTAKRELAEEAQLEAQEWQLLADFFTTPGGSSEHIIVYRATGLSPASLEFEREGEEAELEVRRVPFAEAVRACLDSGLRDGPTVTAVLAEHARRTVNGNGG